MKAWNHKLAIIKFREIEDSIKSKEQEINSLKELKKVVMQYIITFEGTCQECQNAHWPHCVTKEERGEY